MSNIFITSGGRIDDQTAEQIKSAARIVDVVGDFVQLHRQGVNYTALCPFHTDRHLGSFVVSPSKNIFNCFACGKKGDAVTFIMEHEHLSYPDTLRWLAAKYMIDIPDNDGWKQKVKNAKPVEAQPIAEELPTLYLPMEMVTARETTDNDPLCKWLRSLPWSEKQSNCVNSVLQRYHVGASRDGKTIWWQIDAEGRVRTGKLMKYGDDGHRDRQDKGRFDWIHKRLERAGKIDPTKAQMRTCLFGLHLVDRYRYRTINLVESEKTAIICAIAYSGTNNDLWLACGGMSNLSKTMLQPLISRRRKIIAYCDEDGAERWRELVKKLNYPNIVVNTSSMRRQGMTSSASAKMDLGDVIVEALERSARIARGEEPTPEMLREWGEAEAILAEMVERNDAVRELIEKLDLQFVFDNGAKEAI